MPSAEQKVRKRRAAVIRRRRARRKWHNFVAARSGNEEQAVREWSGNEEQAVRECRRCPPDAVGALSRGYGGVPANITAGDFVGYRGGGNLQEGGAIFLFYMSSSRANRGRGSIARKRVALSAIITPSPIRLPLS